MHLNNTIFLVPFRKLAQNGIYDYSQYVKERCDCVVVLPNKS